MKRTLTIILAVALASAVSPAASGKGDDFSAVVKVIERFYRVKHKGIPFLAKAGMKTATLGARIAGGDAKRLAEAGSVRVAYFEDQEFNSNGDISTFRASMQTALSEGWSPFIQTLAPKDEEQTYIYLREAHDKFTVLVVTIARHDATVVQVNLSPRNLALLLRNPDEMGKKIADDATLDDQE
jgi:hypothetical protein